MRWCLTHKKQPKGFLRRQQRMTHQNLFYKLQTSHAVSCRIPKTKSSSHRITRNNASWNEGVGYDALEIHQKIWCKARLSIDRAGTLPLNLWNWKSFETRQFECTEWCRDRQSPLNNTVHDQSYQNKNTFKLDYRSPAGRGVRNVNLQKLVTISLL